MVLLIDNYDSFTHNLARYFAELGHMVQVVRNDVLTVAELAALKPAAVVISPGPCTPDDAGVSLAAIEYFAGRVPLLGVCLGHQAIGQVFGAKVVRSARVMHGKRSQVQHDARELFAGVLNPLTVVRYHSLVLEESSLPADIEVTARVACVGEHAEVMAIQHRHLPLYGVQFHPESVMSQQGHDLLKNFCRLAGLTPAAKELSREMLAEHSLSG
ncbi:MAG: aminodeoxychorismate/anthranilate synthase component II [Idiomarina sp.]|nr:aminodeoxychorismate/anthranilate synthase component II [Idiomarina sp.]